MLNYINVRLIHDQCMDHCTISSLIDILSIELLGCLTGILWRADMDGTAASANDCCQSPDFD